MTLSPLILSSTLFLAAATSQPDSAPPLDETQCTLLIEDIHVRPMDTDVLLQAQDVRLSGSSILAINSTGDPGVRCDQVLDGRGLYVMPGLNDMHTHMESHAMAEAWGLDFGAMPFDALITPYPRYGITGLRVLFGGPDMLEWRNSRTAPSPLFITSGPMLSALPPVLPEPVTQIVMTPDAARAAVREQAEAGYDLIKLRANVTADVHAAIIDEAHALGLHVEGHMPFALSIDEVLRSGQNGMAHLFELAWAIESGFADEAEVIEALQACGCYVSTTIVVTRNIHRQQVDLDAVLERPEMAYMHPLMPTTLWAPEHNPNLNNPQIPRDGFFLNMLAVSQAFAVRLQEAGIPILVGSDALNPMLAHGTSFHDELDLLIEGGLSTYDALRAATATPAEHVPGFEAVGVVAAGRHANLVITREDPVEDHRTLREPAWVILDGAAFSNAELVNAYERSVEAWSE